MAIQRFIQEVNNAMRDDDREVMNSKNEIKMLF